MKARLKTEIDHDYFEIDDDKDVVDMYIFSYPLTINPIVLEKELKKRKLLEWARQMRDKLYGIFDVEWNKKITEVIKQNPIMEKTVATLNALNDLNIAIDDLTVKLTPYLLPKIDEKNSGNGAIKKAEAPIITLEEYLAEVLDKIDYLKTKIKQIDSRIR